MRADSTYPNQIRCLERVESVGSVWFFRIMTCESIIYLLRVESVEIIQNENFHTQLATVVHNDERSHV